MDNFDQHARRKHRPVEGLTPIERLADRDGLARAFQRGVRDAIRRHKLLGEAIVVADENGMPKILEAHEYEIPPDPDAEFEDAAESSVAESSPKYGEG